MPESDAVDPADRTIGDLSACLEPMLRMLPQSDAEVLRKVDLAGEAQTDLATSLGVPLSTIKSRVQRGRTKLRAAFDACCSIDIGRNGAPVAFERGAACPPPVPTTKRRSQVSADCGPPVAHRRRQAVVRLTRHDA